MAINPANLHIVHYPDPVLRKKAQPIEQIDETVRDVAHRMIELLHESEGVGLAAPQVGLPWRMFVANSQQEEDEADVVYINPSIELLGELVAREEGCLSLPGINAEIRRPAAARITATDLAGETFSREDSDLLARVWQHEYDHLDGILILNRMTTIDRLAVRKAVRELETAAKG